MSARGFGAFSNVVFDLLMFSGSSGPTSGGSILTNLTMQKIDEGTGAGTLMTTTQTATATMAYNGGDFTKNAVILRTNISPTVIAFRLNTVTGVVGTVYSAPATTPLSGNVCQLTPDNSVVFLGTNPNTSTTIMQAYAWTDQNGFGTKYADAPTNPTGALFATNQMNVHPSGNAVVISTSATSNELLCVKWDNTTGFGTVYVSGSGQAYSPVAFSKNGNFITEVNVGSGAFIVRPWSTSGFGTVVSQTVTPAKIANNISYNPTSNTVAFSSGLTGNPILSANPISPTTGVLGTSYTGYTVVGVPTSISSRGASFSTSGNSVAVMSKSPNGGYVIGWNGGFTTAYSGISSGSTQSYATRYKKV